ncbi:MAG: cyclic nucleotide-binding domain-containing protein [Alphaproteobacteria bacterium]|nr:cyclic nucleotide-binding domain-containing protein [Alphaproteobacteria bacterium]
MAFLDTFGPTQRLLFEEAATPLRLEKGELLIRRGEPGGDVYLLRSGKLEVVDTRTTPETILNTLTEGTVVGEMAFVDDSPRSVDVRAGQEAEVLRWTREDLRSLLSRHPDLAAAFYQQVARLAATRIRYLTEGAVSGGFGSSDQVPDADEVRAWVARIVEHTKVALPPVETALRRDPDDPHAAQKVREVLDHVEAEVDQLFTATRDPAAGQLASELLGRELHPYLVRSSLAERSIRRPQGVVATAEVMAHVLVDAPGGEGRMGEIVDRWLLDRPTLRALRSMGTPIVEQVVHHLPSHRNRRVLLVDAGTGSLVARMVESLTHPPTLLTVMDQSRDALALLDVGLVDRPRGCELQSVQESLARFAMGAGRIDLPKQDAVVLHNLLEYLPERLAASLLEVARGLLSADGFVLVSTLGPSRDRVFLDRLLSWPTIRRTRGGLTSLLEAAGLQVTGIAGLAAPSLLAVATPKK